MTKLTLSKILLACSLLAASADIAEPSDIWARILAPRSTILPPPEFDKPYRGQLSVVRVQTPDDIKAKCPSVNYTGTPLGCAIAPGNGSWCEIYMVPDELIRSYNVDPDEAYRHEQAHCNGWVHQ